MRNEYFVTKKEKCLTCKGRGGDTGITGYFVCPDCRGLKTRDIQVDLESAVLDIIKINSGSINMALQRVICK